MIGLFRLFLLKFPPPPSVFSTGGSLLNAIIGRLAGSLIPTVVFL